MDVEEELKQEDVEDVQGVLVRDGQEELVAKNNTVVDLKPAREIEVVEKDLKVIMFVEPKVNLAMLDGVSDGIDRGFAAPEWSCVGERAMFRFH